jgi:RHS repeat-associated protein
VPRNLQRYYGEGRRVTKTNQSGTMVFVYDARGRLAAEYGGTATGAATQYMTADHLGSARIITDASKAVVECQDFLPFGDEILATSQNGRSGISCYPADLTRQKFTAKERDGETGLDYFGARYFSSAGARFTSPDPLLNSGRPWNPQSWNRYAYTLNNPLKLVDPSGLYELDNTCNSDDKKCNKDFQQHAKDLRTQLANLQKKVDQVKDPVQKARLQAGLAALGTEGDHNNVTVGFGATKGGGAAETNPVYDPATNSYSGFGVTFDPKQLKGSDAYGIAGAHEGTHVSDYAMYELNPATAMLPFQIEYRGYQTSAFAASALGYSSFSAKYDNKSYVIWNGSWGQVDKNITNFVTKFHDKAGNPTHPEVSPHNPFPN